MVVTLVVGYLNGGAADSNMSVANSIAYPAEMQKSIHSAILELRFQFCGREEGFRVHYAKMILVIHEGQEFLQRFLWEMMKI